MAQRPLTSFGAGTSGDGRSRKYESVRRSLGIPKEAIEATSLEELERRLSSRVKKHVTEANKRQLQAAAADDAAAAAAPDQRSALDLANAPMEEVEFYDPDDEGYDGMKTTPKDYLSEAQAEKRMAAEDDAAAATGEGSLFARRRGASPAEGGFFLRPPAAVDSKAKTSARATKNGERSTGADAPAPPLVAGAASAASKVTPEDHSAGEDVEDDDPRILSLEKLGAIDIASREGSQGESAGSASPAASSASSEAPEAAAEFVAALSFSDLGIESTALLENLGKHLGVATPTRTQTQAIPLVLRLQDTLIQTHTGSGKTLAFLLPLLDRILRRQALADMPDEDGALVPSGGAAGGPDVLVVTPTRELASQIAALAAELLQGTGATALCLPGGANQKRQRERLRKEKPVLVVGTPGRLCELTSKGPPGMGSGVLQTRRVSTMVFDEADALLDAKSTSHKDLRRLVQIVRKSSESLQLDAGIEKKVQMVLASATADKDSCLRMLAQLNDAQAPPLARNLEVVRLREPYRKQGSASLALRAGGEGALPPNIAHAYTVCDESSKMHDTVRRFMNTEPAPECVLVYVQTPEEVTRLADYLVRSNIMAAPLSGKERKDDRVDVLNSLRQGRLGCVVTTDVSGRGLDLPYVTHVVNVGVPKSAKAYIHRAGRSARAGQPGIVLTVMSRSDAHSGDDNQTRRFGLGLLQKYAEQVDADLIPTAVRFGRLLMQE